MDRIVLVAASLAAVLSASGTPASVRSGFVPMLRPGDVFAPVAEKALVGGDPVDTDVVFEAVRIDDFVIDGDVTKPVWRKAHPIPAVSSTESPWPAEYKTDIRLAYSTNALYVAATLRQDMSKLVCKWDQRDMPLWGDDNLEVFLMLTSERGWDFYQYVINPLGYITDFRNENLAYWTKGMKLKVRRFDDRWTVEWKIPFAGIPMDRPVPGEHLAIRFCRTVHNPVRMAQVPVLLSGGHPQHARFAKLVFLPQENADARSLAEERAFREAQRTKRVVAQKTAFMRRFAAIRGGAASLADSTNSLVREAVAGLKQMRKSLEGGFDPSMAAGFDRYASKYAYAVWKGGLWDRGDPEELPPEGARTMPKPILIEQAGNEREAVCLCLRGLLCGPRLDLRIVPEGVTAGKGRTFLSPDAIEVYQEPFVLIDNEIWTRPLVRAPGNVITVSPDSATRVWVVFNSRGIKAGEYATRLLFKSVRDRNVADRELAMGVKVWNFDLPETRDWPIKSFFWGPFAYRMDEVDWLERAHDYHITHGWTQLFRYRYGMYDDNGYYQGPKKGTVKADPEHDFEDEVARTGNQDFLVRAKELGMRFVIGWSTPFSLDWYKTVVKRFLDMGFAYEDFVFHGMLKDEFAKADIAPFERQRRAVYDWNTNLVFAATYLSTPPPTGATLDDIRENKLDDFFKLWWLIHGRCQDKVEGPKMINYLRAKGNEVWTYRCARFMHNKEILPYYRFYPWSARLLGLDGFAYWTIGGPKGDGWDSRDGYDEGITWQGLDKKTVPTHGLEAVREGLEDVAYMDRLEKELARVGKEAHPQYGRLLSDREAIIKRADQSEVDEWRLAVGRAIDALVRQQR